MKVIGITGGVGSGKSAVLAWMEQEYGACICQMDEVAKQLQRKGTECFQKIVDEFGDAVVGEDGELDRNSILKCGKIAVPECNRASGSVEMGAEGY